MVSDQEPRYRLVDDEGNIVGSLYGKPDGSVAIQETDSGSDREVALAPDGTFSAPSVETESVSTESLGFTGALVSDEKKRIDGFSVGSGSFNETVSLAGDSNVDEVGYLIDITGILDNELFEMRVDGDEAENYDWTTENGAGTYDSQSNQTEFRLVNPNRNLCAVRCVLAIYEPRLRLHISRVFGSAGREGDAALLWKGENDETTTELNSLTFTGVSDDFVKCDIYRMRKES